MSRRDPTLHVTRSSLIEILNELNYSNKTTGHKLADMIFDASYKYQITDRYLQILKMKAKGKEKAVRSMEADDVPAQTVEKFNLLLIDVRTKLNPNVKARGILKSSRDYIMLKEIAKMAYDFADHFDVRPKEDGMREYAEVGIKFMGKYGLNKFKTYDSRIYESFESKVAVITDPSSEDTALFYMEWQKKMLEYVGPDEVENLDKDYVKYSNILYARIAADECGADYQQWIEAQFEGLSFVNAIPELGQLYGDNAKKRYERYMMRLVDNKEEGTQDSVLDMYNDKDYDDE